MPLAPQKMTSLLDIRNFLQYNITELFIVSENYSVSVEADFFADLGFCGGNDYVSLLYSFLSDRR